MSLKLEGLSKPSKGLGWAFQRSKQTLVGGMHGPDNLNQSGAAALLFEGGGNFVCACVDREAQSKTVAVHWLIDRIVVRVAVVAGKLSARLLLFGIPTGRRRGIVRRVSTLFTFFFFAWVGRGMVNSNRRRR